MKDSRDPAMNEVRELQASAAASFFQVEDALPADPTPSGWACRECPFLSPDEAEAVAHASESGHHTMPYERYDPTPSAAVAPTGGETVTRYDLCCGEESAWMEPGPTGAYVLFEDVRAALSSPVRAERGEAERDALDARRYRFLRDNPLGLRAVDGNAGYPPATAENFDWYVDDAMAPTPPATPTEPTDA